MEKIYFYILFFFVTTQNIYGVTTATRFSNQVSQITLSPGTTVKIGDKSQVTGWNGLSFVRSTGGSGSEYFGFPDNTIAHADLNKSRVENTQIKTTTVYLSDKTVINNLTVYQEGLYLYEGAVVEMGSPYGLMKELALNNGTLSLHIDWPFSSAASLAKNGGGGCIKGNGYSISMYGNFEIPSGEYLKFKGESTIEGLNHELILTGNGKLIVDMNSTLSLSNITIKYVSDIPGIPSIVMTDSSSKLSLHNVTLILSGNYTFTQGQLFIHNDVTITGTSVFTYTSPQESFIAPNSSLTFDMGTTFSYAPSGAAAGSNSSLIVMQEKSSKLILNNCNIDVPVAGLNLTKGTLVINNKLWLNNIGGTGAGDCLKFGDGSNSSNDLNIEIYPGATINLLSGTIDYSNVN